jgi:hypothetical protein
MKFTSALSACLLLMAVNFAKAQFQYRFDQSIPVKVNDVALAMPWAGGLNGIQLNTMDLNGDTQPDLVVFERQADKILTFINTGSQYTYRPEYEDFFPSEVTQWLLLRDFNCDGKKDLFTRDPLGILAFVNTTRPGQPVSWRPFNPGRVLLTEGNSGNINVQLGFDDIPAIDDVDGDGDLDILNFRFFGSGTVEYHQNLTIERTGRCDSMQLKRITANYGNFEECSCNRIAFDQTCAQLGGGRSQHAVGRVLLNLDVDNDGDRDLIFSEQNCSRLYLLPNEGASGVADFNNFTLFPATNPVAILSFPSPFAEDVTFDGKPDLVVSPNVYTRDFINNSFENSVWLYTNQGTAAAPQFAFTKPDFLQSDMIDAGDNSVPAFFDADGDGDLDLFVGMNGDNNFRATIRVFENIGSAATPEFSLINTDYLGLSLFGFYNLKPQFADINTDGKVDLVFSATRASTGVTVLAYFANQANTGLNFANQEITFTSFSLPASRSSENMMIADINQDGLADLVLGTSTGLVQLWKNAGSGGVPTFVLEPQPFLGLGSSTDRQSPAFAQGDLNGDGKTDLLMGDQDGRLTVFSDYRSGTPTPQPVTVFNPLRDAFLEKKFGGRVWPAIASLQPTSAPMVVVGNTLGGLHALANTGTTELPEEPELLVYPNPANTDANFFLRSDRDGTALFYNLMGQRLSNTYSLRAFEPLLFNARDLAPGLYIVRFTSQGKSISKRLVIR